MIENKNVKRMIILTIIAFVIALGFWLGPMILDLFLEMHGLG